MSSLPRVTSARRAAVALGAFAAASLFLRVAALPVWYWIDEAITVGIAAQPVTEVPGLLRLDGSPPLYYLVLHGWMAMFGTGEVATHALSLAFATLAVPVGWWAGSAVGGRRTGWIVAALAATSPFLTHFAGETRMYSLVVVLSLVVAATFVRGFVHDERRARVAFAVSMAALLYTHNWGLYTALAAGIAGLVPAVCSRDPRPWTVRFLRVMAAVLVVYLPWVLVLATQVADTGAPWAYTPRAREVVTEVAALVRDERVLFLLVVVVAGALLPVLRRPRTTEGATTWVLLVLVCVPVAVGWALSHVEPSWATRYLAVIVGPLLLLVGLGLARAGATGVVALLVTAALWVQPLTRLQGGPPLPRAGKSDARALAADLAEHLEPGDAVIVAQPEAVPLFARYLGTGLRYATIWGEVDRPTVMDWRNAEARLRSATVERHLQPMLRSMAPGARLALIGPGGRVVRTDTAWIRLFHIQHSVWRAAVLTDPRLERLGRIEPEVEGRPRRAVRGLAVRGERRRRGDPRCRRPRWCRRPRRRRGARPCRARTRERRLAPASIDANPNRRRRLPSPSWPLARASPGLDRD